MVPTIEQVLRHYRIISAAERMKTGRPGEETCANAIRGTKCVCEAAGIPLDVPISRLTRKAIDAALATFMARGLSRVSAHSYVAKFQSVFARWCLPYYERRWLENTQTRLPGLSRKVTAIQPSRRRDATAREDLVRAAEGRLLVCRDDDAGVRNAQRRCATA